MDQLETDLNAALECLSEMSNQTFPFELLIKDAVNFSEINRSSWSFARNWGPVFMTRMALSLEISADYSSQLRSSVPLAMLSNSLLGNLITQLGKTGTDLPD